MTRALITLFLALPLALSAGASALPRASAADQAPRQLVWDDLMPIGETELLAELMKEHMSRVSDIREGSANDEMIQVGTFNVVESLDGERVRIPGFVIPFSFNRKSEYDEFLLVPYAGACIHVPPPPPNQIIFVTTPEPVKVPDIWSPVWATGELSTRRHENNLGDAAYSLRLDTLENYEG